MCGGGNNPISSLGNLVSNIPIVGNITDAIDKAAFQTGGFTGLGGEYGIPSLWGDKSGIEFGANQDQFSDATHLAGLIAGTYGAGSGLLGTGSAAGEGGTGALASTTAEEAASVAAENAGIAGGGTGIDAGAAVTPALTSDASLAPAVPPGITEGATPATMNALNSYTLGGAPGATETAGGVSGGTEAGTGVLSALKGGAGTIGKYGLPLYAATSLLGAGMNAAGNAQAANQTNENNANAIAASAWTPARTAAMTNAVDASVLGVYGKSAADQKKTISNSLAEAGRGGGTSEAANRLLGEKTRSAEATGINTAMLNSGAYTPPGLLTGSSVYNNVSPTAASLTGASGALGNTSNAIGSAALLARLYPGLYE